MDVTRVVFYPKDRNKRALAVCSVILDDELRLNDILLHKNGEGYFLILPSRQDVYQDVSRLNSEVTLALPRNALEGLSGGKKYEEFYHPLCNGLYKKILGAVVTAYKESL